MSLLDHAVNVGGFGGTLTPQDMFGRLWVGCTVTRVRMDGCMATIRKVEARGHVVGHETVTDPSGFKIDCVVVDYDGVVKKEPLSWVRFVGRARDAEVWV